MSIKKKLLAVAAVSALTVATAVPAMALENEFHGMFRAIGFISNAYNGGTAITVADDAKTQSYVEQRARIQYIAKANDNLKLVTHFELDSRFGGDKFATTVNTTGAPSTTTPVSNGKYNGSGDAGQLDADSVSLEVKQVYLDYNCPVTGANVKVGIQPWADAYQSTFTLFDGAGIMLSKKFDAFTPSLGWFRINNDTATAPATRQGGRTADLIVADGKFAVTKDLTVGGSYYALLNDSGALLATGSAGSATSGFTQYEVLHMVGLNAAAKFGPAAVNAFAAYQFGDVNDDLDRKISAFGTGATAKVKAGPGNVNLAALYLSGDKKTDSVQHGWQVIAPNTTYFNAANMWLLVRSGQTANTSTAIGGNNLNKGGRGLIGAFAGYDLAIDKVFANANLGTAWAARTAGNEEAYIGTEANLQVGYKMYDNLSVSVIGAYLFLGDGANGTAAERLGGSLGATDADDPYVTALLFNYAF